MASLSPLEYLDSLQASGIRPGLGRIRALLRHLGRPERAYRSIIVAGTNGKGSTSATIASILEASGYKTGLYTSPHLVDIRERWRIGGRDIDDDLLSRSVERLRDAAGAIGIEPTYFEALTVVAFIAFALAACDVAVLEVGMGGRLDATNVVRPIAAVITPIGFDHMEYLGNTIRKIAREKAGVIHRGAVVLTSNDDRDVIDVLRHRAEQFDARFIVVNGEHQSPLVGPFQRRNAALAVRTAEELRHVFPRITPQSIERGVATTQWRGRLERIDIAGKQVWIDGCHNPHAMQAVIPFIRENVGRPRLLVFGIMSDKDVDAVVRDLFPLFDFIITTEPFPPRSAKAETLAAAARAMHIDSLALPSPGDAFEAALRAPQQSIFIGGSLYLAGAAIEFLDSLSE
ncbi:MAG: bifunctional folylpolyglutamate synthase/dihydrofolate synthase [Thermoanaerobaculia bacterium]